MKEKNITMKDIAIKAGVSITTVSHVINKTRFVRQDTRELVLNTIQDLNYRSTKTKKPEKIEYIGVIIADIREDYYISVVKAIETIATDLGIAILFCDSEDDPEKEVKNIKIMLDRNINGLIISPIESGAMPRNLRSAQIPVVLIDRQYESHDFTFIGINNFQSSFMGAQHLLEKGCKKIGFIGYSESVYTIKQRIMGYKSFVQERMKDETPSILNLSYHREDSYPLIKAFLESDSIDGIICATSSICYELISVINDMKTSLQQKMKIITYDDNKWFDYLKFPVSVISQPTAEIGGSALEYLISSIEQPDTNHHVKRELYFDFSIIDR